MRAQRRRRHGAALGSSVRRRRDGSDLLLHAGARVNVANDLGVTPLYLACTNRDAAMVEKLLSAEANPDAKLLNGETVLMNCARTGNAEAVKALVAAGANVNVKEPDHDQTALMWAAAESHPEAVKILIEAGADIQGPLTNVSHKS